MPCFMKRIYLTGIALPHLFALIFGGHYISSGKERQECMEFVILTLEYRKSIVDATVDYSKALPELVKQYSQDVGTGDTLV